MLLEYKLEENEKPKEESDDASKYLEMPKEEKGDIEKYSDFLEDLEDNFEQNCY